MRSNSGYGVIDKESESKFNVKKEKLSNLYDYANAYYGSKVFSKPKRDLSMINLIKDNDNWKYHRSQMTK